MQMAFDVDATADVRIQAAKTWRAENPAAYGAIVAWAYEDAAQSGRCSMQRYFEALRDPRFMKAFFIHRIDDVYVVNHNLRSALTRLVLAENPHLPFHPRKSSCDTGVGNATPMVRP